MHTYIGFLFIACKYATQLIYFEFFFFQLWHKWLHQRSNAVPGNILMSNSFFFLIFLEKFWFLYILDFLMSLLSCVYSDFFLLFKHFSSIESIFFFIFSRNSFKKIEFSSLSNFFPFFLYFSPHKSWFFINLTFIEWNQFINILFQ